MFDLIEVIAAILSFGLLIFAILNARNKQLMSCFSFVIVALWPLMWAGFIRISIPQSIIWIGMNLFVIIFLWQAVSGVLFKNMKTNVMNLPPYFSVFYRTICSLLLGIGFAALLILSRL